MNEAILFDDVPEILVQVVRESQGGLEAVERLLAIRDLFGRARFLLDTRPPSTGDLAGALGALAERAHERLGPRGFPPAQVFLYRDELGEDVVLPEGRLLDAGPPELRLIDRQITGRSWGTGPTPPDPSGALAPRLAFYSLKGGVGRSTAAAAAAWHLARGGRSVLVVDLDLEAPGLSAGLLPPDRLPEQGIADWFVEDAVGQGDAVLSSMLASAPLAERLPGEIRVAPSFGAEPGDYLAKLGRCYLDIPRPGRVSLETWEQRLVRLVAALEQREKPDVTLLDVRAGLPDLSSVAVTELGAEVLLFASDSDQTWAGYRLLFERFEQCGAALALREHLLLVAALVPETEREAYLGSLRERAWDLFRDHLYDAVEPSSGEGEPDAFSFDLADEDAPHAPTPIYWSRGLQSLRNLQGLDPTLVEAAFGAFLKRVEALVAEPQETDR